MDVCAVNNRTHEAHPPEGSRGYWRNLAKGQLEDRVIGPFGDDPNPD
jgi:hypothetical protein